MKKVLDKYILIVYNSIVTDKVIQQQTTEQGEKTMKTMNKIKEIIIGALADAISIMPFISGLIILITIPFLDSVSPIPMAILIAFLGLLIISLAVIYLLEKSNKSH